IVKIRDPPFADEIDGRLQLPGPDRSVGPSRIESRRVWRIERERGLAGTITKSFDLVRLPIPPRIGHPLVFPDADPVSRVLVTEHIRGVVEDYIEDAVDTLLVCRIDQVAQIFACAEMRVDVEKVLNAIAVVSRFERHLFEN